MGGAFFGGIGAAPGAIGGAALGSFGGALSGLMTEKNNPTQSDVKDLQELYAQLVAAYAAQNGGRRDLAAQQAKAKMHEIALGSVQADDYLDDFDADRTRELFQGIR